MNDPERFLKGDQMKARSWIYGILVFALAVAASAQEMLPPGHVHEYDGTALVFAQPDGRIVVALGTDGVTEHLFLFQPATVSGSLWVALEAATVEYDHDSVILTAPLERVAVALAVERMPVHLAQPRGETRRVEPRTMPDGFAVTRLEGGIGLAHYSDLPDLPLDESTITSYLDAPKPFQKPPPPPPGGGGCARSCSISCQYGSGSVSCAAGNCAYCSCTSGYPDVFCSI